MKLLQNPCRRSRHGFSLRWEPSQEAVVTGRGLPIHNYQSSSSVRAGACAYLEQRARKIGLAAGILVASAGAVAADERYAFPGAPGFYAYREGRSSAVPQEQTHQDSSAIVGRMGLGADPTHPDGPGNFSF
jgi:hypothetical protein